jgi:hypothetical protein
MQNQPAFLTVLGLLVPISLGAAESEARSTTVRLSRSYNLSAALETWNFEREPRVPKRDPRFIDLQRAEARSAEKLQNGGQKLGLYVEEEPQFRDAIHFLVENGVPDANWHLMATVHLMSDGHDHQGYWCLLVSQDSYFTNSANADTYDFGMRIGNDGVIRLVSPKELPHNLADRQSGAKGRRK